MSSILKEKQREVDEKQATMGGRKKDEEDIVAEVRAVQSRDVDAKSDKMLGDANIRGTIGLFNFGRKSPQVVEGVDVPKLTEQVHPKKVPNYIICLNSS